LSDFGFDGLSELIDLLAQLFGRRDGWGIWVVIGI
jgi:hypothetical protein